jgi:Fe-S-cluster containining protein
MSDPLHEAQLARWNDPATQEAASRRAEAVEPRINTSEVQRCAERAEVAPSMRARIHWLHVMADTWGAAVATGAACKRGCAHCCYQAVTITQAEAQAIGQAIGVKPRNPAHRPEPALEFTNVPCPFLKDNLCSIYEHRPFACRVLFNMDADNLLCQHAADGGMQVPYANYRELYERMVTAHMPNNVRLADIRDFFPNGKR